MFFGLTHETHAADLIAAPYSRASRSRFADGQDVLLEKGGSIDEISVTVAVARACPIGAQLLAAALNRPSTYRAGSEVGAALGAARLGRLAADR